jgi:exodeoxyribonuclease-3
MRVMTYNIWNGGGERVALIAQVIASANPDVLLLNEADDEGVVAELARMLEYKHLWARGSGDKHIALLTRLPIVEWHIYNQRPFTQAILSATLALGAPRGLAPGPVFQLFGVHLLPYFMLLPYEVARWRTLRALLQLSARDATGPHILLGDFNSACAGELADTRAFPAKIRAGLRLQANLQPRFALSTVQRAGYTDCFRHAHPHEAGQTWMTWAPSARLDYIFADTRMAQQLRGCDVLTAVPAERASDHFPLLAEFG